MVGAISNKAVFKLIWNGTLIQLIELIYAVLWAEIVVISPIRSISVPFYSALPGSASYPMCGYLEHVRDEQLGVRPVLGEFGVAGE